MTVAAATPCLGRPLPKITVQRFSVAHPPIEYDALLRVIARLERADALLPSFEITQDRLYSLDTYMIERSLHTADFVALFDRNVLSCVLDLAGGRAASQQHRDAAALMAFVQCFDIAVEPSLALYEYAAPHNSAAAMAQLAAFRAADNRHPTQWAAVALEHAQVLPFNDTPPLTLDSAIDFERPLMRWRRNYIHCLKVAAIELAGGSAARRMQQYLDWSFTDFQLGGAALGLASLLFAPNGPRKGLMSGIRSADRDRALNSVRNTAWDLTVVSAYVDAISEQVAQHRCVLLCSFDAGLKRIARAVAGDPDDVATTWQGLWGQKLGSSYLDRIGWMHQHLDDPSRKPTTGNDSLTIDDLIAEGELRILSWNAGR